jgi:hypothetical protein
VRPTNNIQLTFIKGKCYISGGREGEQELARLTRPCGELGIREIPAALKFIKAVPKYLHTIYT